jgi:hypothetical protein
MHDFHRCFYPLFCQNWSNLRNSSCFVFFLSVGFFILNYFRIVIYALTLFSYKFLKVPWVESQDSIETTRGRQIKITEDVDTFNELNSIIYRILEMSYYSGILPLGFISVWFFQIKFQRDTFITIQKKL